MILPSLLEYTENGLKSKLTQITENSDKWQDLTLSSSSAVSLHLDFVLGQFAKDRSVMKSLSQASVFKILNTHFSEAKLDLSIHLMGTLEDLVEAFGFWQQLDLNPNWSYRVYVPKDYYSTWDQSSFRLLSPEILTTGIWYDLGDWNLETFNEEDRQSQNYLLMTVKAGKSGQKLSEENKQAVFQTAQMYPSLHFLADGGWSIEELNSFKNLDIISYSSFWNHLETLNFKPE